MRDRRRAACISIDAGGHRERVLRRRDELVLAHMAMVPPIAQRMKERLPDGFELEDLIAIGNLALIRAATRFRPRGHGGAPFPAFAKPRIAGAMLDSVRRGRWAENTRERIPEDFEVPFYDPFAAEAVVSIDTERGRKWDSLRGGRRKDRVQAAIWALTTRQRAVLGAFYAADDLSAAAGICGLSEQETEFTRDEALGRLRVLLKVREKM